MITNFEEITEPLTEYEIEMLDMLILGFRNYKKDNPIKAPEIIRRINSNKSLNLKLKLTGARLRKLVNHIRVNTLLPLIATSNGYYTSNDKEELQKQIKSLNERAYAILGAAKGLEKFLKEEK